MPSPARSLSLAAAFAIAASLGYAALQSGGPSPLDAIPAASFLVASVDMAALRASPLGTLALEKEPAVSAPVAELALACGFDPLSRLDEIVVALPEGNDPGEFGVAASAKVSKEELVHCAESIAGRRGEARSAEDVGHFHVLTDDKGHALAVRETGNPILVAKGAWMRSMIDAADGRAPSLRTSRAHSQLRQSLLARGGKALLVATALLPSELRERLKHEMGAELGETGATANLAMAGVLGVSAAGLSVSLTDDGSVEARVELRCESGAACDEVKRLVLEKRLEWSSDLALRMVGVGTLVDALDVETHGSALSARIRATPSQIEGFVERLRRLRGARAPRTPEARPQPRLDEPPRPAPRADEVLRPAARDAGAPGKTPE